MTTLTAADLTAISEIVQQTPNWQVAKLKHTIRELITQLEARNYECPAGSIERDVVWQELKKMVKY